MIDSLIEAFVSQQGWLPDHVVQPPLLALGMGSHLEMAFDGIQFFLAGVLQIGFAYLLLRPLAAWRPVEVWPDRRAVCVDVVYTLLDRLGIVPLAVFALLAPILALIDGWLRLHDIIPPQPEDLIGGFWFASIALLVGVPPGQFIGLLLVVKTVENLAHVNARLSFGRFGERLLVSPRYHRWHHALHLPPGRRYHHGCNFAVLLPIWDQLFGTQYRGQELPPCGLAGGPLPPEAERNGFWRQQWQGLQAFAAALRPCSHDYGERPTEGSHAR